MQRPPSGTMVYWRHKNQPTFKFGYVTYLNSSNLIRMGRWNGDTVGGYIVDYTEIEWRPYV